QGRRGWQHPAPLEPAARAYRALGPKGSGGCGCMVDEPCSGATSAGLLRAQGDVLRPGQVLLAADAGLDLLDDASGPQEGLGLRRDGLRRDDRRGLLLLRRGDSRGGRDFCRRAGFAVTHNEKSLTWV